MIEKPFLIGEIGINHNGNIELAKQLINVAKGLGWNAVKFQKRTLETVIPKEMWHIKKETPWGIIDYIEYKKHLEFGRKEYDIIDKYCKEIGIEWFASAWDLKSQKFLDKYNLKYNKIASAMRTNWELLEHVAKQGKTTFISTGLSSTWWDIDNAFDIFEKNNCPYIPMHCVGLYPCPLNKLNLYMIKELKLRYGVPIGYSGHSEGAMDAILATILGAEYIEKHITLNRAMFGSDQSASIEPGGMEFISKHTEHISMMLGTGKKIVSEEEEKIGKKLRYWE